MKLGRSQKRIIISALVFLVALPVGAYLICLMAGRPMDAALPAITACELCTLFFAIICFVISYIRK